MEKKEYTKTTTFLFPLLGIPVLLFKTKKGSRLVNCFLNDVKISKYKENCVFVVVDNFQDVDFVKFEKELEAHSNFQTAYDILDGKYSVKVFKVLDEFAGDYSKFLDGKYSKFSEAAKDKVINSNFKGENFLNHIFTKSPEARKILEESLGLELPTQAEVYGIYSVEKEVLNVKTLKMLTAKSKKKKIIPYEEFN